MEWDIVDDAIVNILYSINAEEWKVVSKYTDQGLCPMVYFSECVFDMTPRVSDLDGVISFIITFLFLYVPCVCVGEVIS